MNIWLELLKKASRNKAIIYLYYDYAYIYALCTIIKPLKRTTDIHNYAFEFFMPNMQVLQFLGSNIWKCGLVMTTLELHSAVLSAIEMS